MWMQKSAIVPQKWIYRLQRKTCKYEVMDNMTTYMIVPWYPKGKTYI